MVNPTHFGTFLASSEFSSPKRRLRAYAAATFAALGATFLAATAQAAPCPVGSYCYYAPPLLPAPSISPQAFAGDIVLAAPTGTISGTYAINGGAPAPFSVTSGTPLIIALGPGGGITSGFNVANQRGVEVVANTSELIVDQRQVATFWQSSSTVKSNVIGLGTRFRAGGFASNADNGGGDGTGYDFVSMFAPTGATITLTAPPGAMAPYWHDGIAGLTHVVTLQAGQTQLVRTLAGVDIDGALITSTTPVSVASGGRGWSPPGCGDDGMDHLVPTNLLGTQFVVDDYPSTSGERVRVVTDTNATAISVNGTVVATINAGERYDITPTGVTFIETSKPAYVYQNAGLNVCENDIALIPPVVFAVSGGINLAFDVLGTGVVNVVIPTASVSTLRLDGAMLMTPSIVAVPGHPEWSRVRFNVTSGAHSVSANSDFQLGLVSGNGGAGLFAYYNPYRLAGCGDGVVTMPEACDDGNVDDADGCSATCQVEATYECMGQPSMCQVIDTDGDGMGDYIETQLGYDPNNADADGDGVLDPADLDLDNDGIPNTVECNTQAFSLVNGSFELPPIAANTVSLLSEDLVPGWETTASDNQMELWGTGFNGVASADGNQFAELNAFEVATLYQDIATTPGEVYFYRFYHRGRIGADTLAFNVGNPIGAQTKIREVTTGNMAWKLVTGLYTIPAGQTTSRFAFESVSAAGGNPGVGNFLDGIAFTPGCKVDTDNDGTLDFRDMDSDGDMLPDGVEAGHGMANMMGTVPGPYGTNGLGNMVETPVDSGDINYMVLDTDGDGIPNFQEVDSDNDGVNDNIDVFPLDPLEWVDADNDGVGDNGDNCPMAANMDQADMDMDGIGDACDIPDADQDGIADAMDNCPMAANMDQADADMDGTGDVCEPDTDMDGVIDDVDNCDNLTNTDHADADMDGIGDACEADTDTDGIIDDVDNCAMTANVDQADADKDGIGDACEIDTDKDGIIDDVDNCVMTANADQADTDMNGIGNACEVDADADGIADGADNCPTTANAEQADSDRDGLGDVCDEGIIVSGDGCACRQGPSSTGDVGGGAMAAFGAILLGWFRRRRNA